MKKIILENIKQIRLPQELLAEALWLEWFIKYGCLSLNKVEELLRFYNLKPKKGKSIDDVRLAFSRKVRNTSKSIEEIAEEIDKVCVIAKWDSVVAKYYYR